MKIISLMQRIVVVLIFLFGSVSLFAQQVLVRGIVKDASGEPIIGASLLEIGTTNGTVTDFDGNFELNVASNAKLQVSYLGYQTAKVIVSSNIINIQLSNENVSIEGGVLAFKKRTFFGRLFRKKTNWYKPF